MTRRGRARAQAGPRRILIAVFFFLLAIPLYGNTLGNRYALDDSLFITSNKYTTSGIRGIPAIFGHDSFHGYFGERTNMISGGRYRPLSIATFALEVQVAGLTPWLGHLVNLLLYGVTGALLYLLLARLLPPDAKSRWWSAPPFLIALLFMTHPLHTEVVANIKGRDEILALLLSVAAFHAFLSYCERPGGARGILGLAAGAFLVFLGLLAKETVIPFVVIIPLGLWFFRKDNRWRLGVVLGALALPTAAYLVVRRIFAGPMEIVRTSELLNDPFALASVQERVATIFKTLGIYFRLFFFPHPLTHDYYYNQVPLTTWGDPSSWVPALIALGLAILAVAGMRHKSPFAFGLLLFAITFSIVSNLFFSIGTTMAERFLYIPSLGLAISSVFALRFLSEKGMGKKGPRVAAVLVLVVSVLFSVKTILRNPVWKDNLTLFSTDVKTSSHSAKVRLALAATLTDMAAKEKDPGTRRSWNEEARVHLTKAVEIYPGFVQAWFDLGNVLAEQGKVAEARRCYQRVIALDPDKAMAYRNLAMASDKLGDPEAAISNMRHFRALDPRNTEAGLLEAGLLEKNGRLEDAARAYEELVRDQPRNAVAWGEAGRFFISGGHDYARASEYLSRAIALDSTKVYYYENLGGAQVMSGQHKAAIRTLEAGVARFGETYLLERNLGAAWENLGDRTKAERYQARALQLRANAAP